MKTWHITCDPEKYEIELAFNELKQLPWKMNNYSYEIGDIVLIYVTKYLSCIKYKAKVVKINRKFNTPLDEKYYKSLDFNSDNQYMILELVETYKDYLFDKAFVLSNGIRTLQGPTYNTDELVSAMELRLKESQVIENVRNYYFVYQNEKFQDEKNNNYLWSPKTVFNKRVIHHWKRMSEVKKGDIIVHSNNRMIVAISVVEEDCNESVEPIHPKTDEIGYMVKTNYINIPNPILTKDHIVTFMKMQPEKYGPFASNEIGNRGYLFKLNKELTEYIISETIKNQIDSTINDLLNNLLSTPLNYEEKIEQEFVDKSANEIFNEDEQVNYQPKPESIPEQITNSSSKSFKRNTRNSRNALIRAEHMCEIDNSHQSFERRKSSVQYVEPHHLIPLNKQSDFEYSLDVEANLVSLCSTCHKQVHYGKGYEEIVTQLWSNRIEELKLAGIEIDLSTLLSYY